MKCPRTLCRQRMTFLGDGEFLCSEEGCGATVRLTDPAVGKGPTASSKPSTAEERLAAAQAAIDARLISRSATMARLSLAGTSPFPELVTEALKA